MILTGFRLLAGAIDLFLLASYIIGVCFFVSEWELTDEPNLFFSVFATSIPIIYFALLESGYGGCSTIGKRFLGLQVLDWKLNPLTLSRSSTRAALKLLIPATFVLGSVRLQPIILFVALIILGVLILPVSICIGKGAVGIEDLLAKTIVRRRIAEVPKPVNRQALYIVIVLFVSSGAAFPISAFGNHVFWGARNPTISQVADSIDGSVDVSPSKVILDDLAATDLGRYINQVSVVGAIEPFPDSFESPLARQLGDVSALKGLSPVATIDIDMTRRGYDSEMTRVEILRRLTAVLPKLMAPASGQAKFFWVSLRKTDTFGFLRLSRGTRHIVLYRKAIKSSSNLNVGILEPNAFRETSVWLVTPP